jgi:phage minor structural protein
MDVKFLLYSRWNAFGCEFFPFSAEHYQKINGEDELIFTTDKVVAKGDRILWFDGAQWFEHVVDEVQQKHDGAHEVEVTCISSLQSDLELAHVRLAVWNNVSAAFAAEGLLQLTTWKLSEGADETIASYTFERQSVYDCLLDIEEACGLEFQSEIEVGHAGVVSRKLKLVERIGADNGARFDYGFDVKGVTKTTCSDSVFSACYGYGKQLDSTTDGVKDRLTFANINNGIPYVTSESALELWGLPDGSGGKMHTFGFYENTDCESASQLLAETKAYLSEHSVPAVSYETTAPFASLKGVHLGDTVRVVDKDLNIRFVSRIGELKRDLLSGETSSATFGTIMSLVPDILARAYTKALSSEEASRAYAEGLATKVETQTVETDEVTTQAVVIKSDSVWARITVVDGELYFNDKKIQLVADEEAESGQEE